MTSLAAQLYLEPAGAFVRGRYPEVTAEDAEAVRWARGQGVRLHRYKRKALLPRVRRVLGILRGLQPERLIDIGSGRGTFLWPLLDTFADMAVTSVEVHPRRVEELSAVQRGGLARLSVVEADAQQLLEHPALEPRCADVVTALEVLEHMVEPSRACQAALSLARRFVIATVPSKPDDNPEHIQLFDRNSLQQMFSAAGATRVEIDYIHNHIVVVARV